MAYSTRSTRRVSKNAKKKLIYTALLLLFIIYASINWIIPNLIDGLGTIRDTVNPSIKKEEKITDQEVLAPPTLNIPYEATNTAVINLSGYAEPNTKIQIFLDDNLEIETETKSDGSFLAKELTLVLGTNNINAKANRDKKESLLSKTFKIIYDKDSPALTISEPPDGKEIQGGDKKVKVSGKADFNSQVFINDSRVVLNSDGNFSTEVKLNEGENSIIIKAQDNANNITEVSRKVIYKP